MRRALSPVAAYPLGWSLSLLYIPLAILLPVRPALAKEPGTGRAAVIVEGARLPAGTIVEPLGEAMLVRLGEQHLARRYRCTGVPTLMQTSCNYIGGTEATKTALWEMIVFDDPSSRIFTRLVEPMLVLRERLKAEALARWGSPNKAWEQMPSLLPPIVLCAGPGLDSRFEVVWAADHLWEWTFQGFAEGGTAFGNDSLPEKVLYDGKKGSLATRREGFTSHEKEFCPVYLTAP